MDDWKKLNETLLEKKKDFQSYLNMEDITDADYTHVKRVCIKNLSEYYDLFVESDTLLPDDVFCDFRNMYLKIRA